MYQCNECSKTFQRKDNLKRHASTVHGVSSVHKRKHLDESNSDDDGSYSPLERSKNDGLQLNEAPGFVGYESLMRSDAVPEKNIVRGPNNFTHQALSPRSEPF